MRSYYVLWIICVPDKCSRYCDLFHCSSKLGYHQVAIVEISILEPCVNRCPLVVTGYSSLWFFCLPSSAPQNTHMPLLQETQVRIIAIVKKNIYYFKYCMVHIHHPPPSPHLHRVWRYIPPRHVHVHTRRSSCRGVWMELRT